MKKLLLGLFLILLVFGIGYADKNGDLELSNPVNPSVVQGSTATVSFTATNYNTTGAMTVSFTSSQPVSGSNTLPTPTISNIVIPMAASSSGQSTTASFNVNVPATAALGTYTATISAIDVSNPNNNATLSYNVIVQQTSPSLAISNGLDSDGNFIISGPDNGDLSRSFTVNNNGNINLTDVQVKISGESDAFTSGSKTITFKINGNAANLNTFYSIGSINVGASPSVSITAHIPNNMDVDTYEGNITVSSNLGANVTFPLLVRVEPEICSDGRVSNGNSVNFNSGNLRVTIDEPDNNDDFKQNDEIDVSVTVDNGDNNDMDVVVEAILYDVSEDNEITSAESDSKEINDNDEEDFDLTLTVPYNEDLDDNNQYILYVKAYEDGNENENCEYDGVDLDFKRNSHEVIIDSFTITPTIASCGNLVNFNVNVLNIGEQDEDNVKVTLTNTELGLSESSTEFDLDDYSGSDNDALKSFSFTIPSNTQEKDYSIGARVYYDDQDKSNDAFGTLTISNCLAAEEEQTIVSLSQTSFSPKKGEVFTIPVTITNNQNTAQTYTIEFNPTGSWTETATETLSVNPGESSTAYLYVTPLASASGGQAGTVTVKQNGNTVDTESVIVSIQSETTPSTGGSTGTGASTYQPTSKLWDELTSNTAFWIIGDIILVILIVLVLVLIFRRR